MYPMMTMASNSEGSEAARTFNNVNNDSYTHQSEVFEFVSVCGELVIATSLWKLHVHNL